MENFKITGEQLDELIEKLKRNVGKITHPKGEYIIESRINNSLEATIKNYLKKNCSK